MKEVEVAVRTLKLYVQAEKLEDASTSSCSTLFRIVSIIIPEMNR